MINNFLDEAMASDARLVTRVLASSCKDVFERLNSLVDVGGGTGTVAKAIAKVFPHIECTVFDLPHVVADIKSDIDNLKFIGANMFKEVPPADAVLLKCILHNWNDEDCVKILKNCKKAITSDGKVGKLIIIDMILGNIQETNDKSVVTQLFFDLSMMVFFTGKERDEKEWATLFLRAGFNDYKITPIFGLRSLIEIYPL